MIDDKTLHEVLVSIGDEQNLATITCIAVDEAGAHVHSMHNSKCPYALDALRLLAMTLRELAEQVDYTAEGMLADEVAKEFIE